jgi:hypothetical protein
MSPVRPHRTAEQLTLLAAALALGTSGAASAQAQAQAETARARINAPEPVLRIAELRLRERQVLLVDVILYETGEGDLLVPFAPLMEALELRLEATPNGGIAGWFLRESQQLNADPDSGRVQVAGRDLALMPGDLAMIDGELHIATAALDRWLALGVGWDPATQTLSFVPPYQLPAEERAARQRAAGRGGDGQAGIDATGFVPVSAPWSALGWPHLTLNLAAAYDDRAGGTVVQGNALAEGDLLWATGRLAVAGTSQGGVDARLTLARQDPQARMLGIGASIVEAGDIAVPVNPLLQRNVFGVGVRVGREPLGAVGEFDRSDLIGDAPPGWQAELYRDSALLGFQTIASDGRYFFPQVPVLFGINRFRIVLYGPAGERQEIARTIDIGSSLIRPGELRYNLVALRQGYALFNGRIAPDTAEPAAGLADPDQPLLGFQQPATYVEARAAYGLNRNLGLSGFAAWRNVDGGGPALGYIGLGSIARIGGALAAFDAIAQQNGAAAARASLSAGLGPASLTATHERYDAGFVNEDSGPERGGIAARSQVVVDGRLGGVGLGLGVAVSDSRNGGSDRTVNLRANAMIAGFSLSNNLFWRDFQSGPGLAGNDRLDGQFALSGSIGRVRLRGGLDYSVMPQWRLRRLRGEVSYRLGDWFLAATADRDLESGAGQWGLVATRDWNGVRLGTDIRYEDSRGDWRGLMTLSLALDRDPLGRGVRFGRAATSQRGSVIASGFRDANANGQRDAGEARLDQLDIRIDPRGRVQRGEGAILAEELPLDRAVAVAVMLDGIDDPFLVPAAPGYSVTPRAGRPVRIDIPLVESGEVVASLGADGAEIVAELVSCTTGDVVQRERSAFDGQVFFAAVLPGCYELRAGSARAQISVMGGDVTRVDLETGEGTGEDAGRDH